MAAIAQINSEMISDLLDPKFLTNRVVLRYPAHSGNPKKQALRYIDPGMYFK